ncbi:MAG: cell division protein FtsQ/DivIB [Pseudomonadota bacterium]
MGLFKKKKTNRIRKPARKPTRPAARWTLPRPRFDKVRIGLWLRRARRVAMASVIGIGLVAVWHALDRPVTSIEVVAPFQRVTPMQVEDHVQRHLDGGILSGDLAAVRASLEGLPWVDSVRIRRRWPARLRVELTEQVAAARWGERGLVNTRGELFVDDARHVPPELPSLEGPDDAQWEVSQRYLALRKPVLDAGLQLLTVSLDTRGSWRLVFARDLDVRLGRDDVDQRIERFINVVTPIIAGRVDVIDYVDLRYTNGFAIGWHDVASDAVDRDATSETENDDV